MTILHPYKDLIIHLCTSGAFFESNLISAREIAEQEESEPEYEYWLIEFQLPNGLNAFAECFPFFNDWAVWIDANGISNEERELFRKMEKEMES